MFFRCGSNYIEISSTYNKYLLKYIIIFSYTYHYISYVDKQVKKVKI